MLNRVEMSKANARTFACEACGALVDWMSAFKRAADRESTSIEPGDAGTSKACCILGDRRYRAPPRRARQMERLEGLVSGSHTWVHHPPDTVSMIVHMAGGQRAGRMVSRARKALRRLLVEREERNGPPMLVV